jgi:hypothetical protein
LITVGDTFLARNPPEKHEHLWIVLTTPDITCKAVCVSITTDRWDKDRTIILKAGDHPFIVHDSVVFYEGARVFDMNVVQAAIDAMPARLQPPCGPSVLKRIRQGLCDSPHTTYQIRAHYEKSPEANA